MKLVGRRSQSLLIPRSGPDLPLPSSKSSSAVMLFTVCKILTLSSAETYLYHTFFLFQSSAAQDPGLLQTDWCIVSHMKWWFISHSCPYCTLVSVRRSLKWSCPPPHLAFYGVHGMGWWMTHLTSIWTSRWFLTAWINYRRPACNLSVSVHSPTWMLYLLAVEPISTSDTSNLVLKICPWLYSIETDNIVILQYYTPTCLLTNSSAQCFCSRGRGNIPAHGTLAAAVLDHESHIPTNSTVKDKTISCERHFANPRRSTSLNSVCNQIPPVKMSS